MTFPDSYMDDSWFRRIFAYTILNYFHNGWFGRFCWFYPVYRTSFRSEAAKMVEERFFLHRYLSKIGEASTDVFLQSELLLLGKVVPVTKKEAFYRLDFGSEKEYKYIKDSSNFFLNQVNKLRQAFFWTWLFYIRTRLVYEHGGMRYAVPFGIGAAVVLSHMLVESLYWQVTLRLKKIWNSFR
jgi:hypothetical protein